MLRAHASSNPGLLTSPNNGWPRSSFSVDHDTRENTVALTNHLEVTIPNFLTPSLTASLIQGCGPWLIFHTRTDRRVQRGFILSNRLLNLPNWGVAHSNG